MHEPTPHAIITAGLLVIGDEILSGRTKDKNIGFIAEYLTALGIDLKEVRVVPDDEAEIVAALNALRHRYTYVFTTGGIGPTHDDITADSVAKAFGVPIDVDPRVVEIFKARAPAMQLNEARLRMARIPQGAALVDNKISAAPGFWLGNVIVMAGVPSIMQSMLDAVVRQAHDRRQDALGNRPRRRARGRYRHAARRDRQGQSGRDPRQLPVLRRDRTQYQHRRALARRRETGCRQTGG